MIIMCNRCGTGAIAWCTDPDRHGDERKMIIMTSNTPQDEQWETIAEHRTKMIFDTDGDEFRGTYEGFEHITDPNTGEVYEYANFRNDDGEPLTTSASYQLKRALTNVTPGKYVRLIRTGQTDMGKNKAPMTNFKVMVRK
jgi:hypothetical protein